MNRFYVPDFLVKVAGLTMEADISRAVMEVSYDNNLDTADMFTLRLNNGDLRLTDSPLLEVGKEVELYMGYVGDLHPMLLGEITAIQPSFPASGAPTLTLTGYDKSQRMRHNSPGRFTFKSINDSLIVAQIAAENRLIPLVDPSPLTPDPSVQQMGSDWALLKALADRNHFDLFVRWDKLIFQAPRPQTEMVVLEWGRNLSSFSPRFSTAGQAGFSVVRGYDEELAQEIVAVLPMIALDGDLEAVIERMGSRVVEMLANLGRRMVRSESAVKSHLTAKLLAQNAMKQLLQGLFEGSGNCIGLPSLRAGDLVEIRGLGKRFSGQYRLRQVTHTINEGGYSTQFEVSQQYQTTLLSMIRENAVDAPSPRKAEKIEGMLIGKVVDNIDPTGLGQVQIFFADLSDVNLSHWARIATPMAGNNAGLYFLPDVGDEVLVAFVQGDINQPVVVGALWNGKQRPPETSSGANSKKMIKTKAGHTITLDDQAKNIQISSAGTLTIQAEGDIDIQAANVNVKVTGTMDISGAD